MSLDLDALNTAEDQIRAEYNLARYAGKADKKLCYDLFLSSAPIY